MEDIRKNEPWHGNEKKHKSKNFFVQFFVNQLNKDILTEIDQIKTHVKTMLDIGCGEGFITSKISVQNTNFEITAIDAEESYIQYAKQHNQKNNINFCVQNLESIDSSNKFDLVVMTEVLEHLPNPDAALKKIVLLASKYIIITVPNEPFFRIGNLLALKYVKRLGNTPGHLNNWSKKGLCKLLDKFSFKYKIKTSFFWNIAVIKVE